MALIVEYHVLADMYPMGSTEILAGMNVSLNGAGQVIPTPLAGNVETVLGIAGDSDRHTQGQTTAYSDQVLIGAGGGWAGGAAGTTRWTENRVPDFYDETAAAGKMTIYHGGGKFWISCDLFDDEGTTVAVNDMLTRSGTVAGEWNDGATGGQEVAIAVGTCQQYPSGVPGTDVQGSISLGDYVPVVLRR